MPAVAPFTTPVAITPPVPASVAIDTPESVGQFIVAAAKHSALAEFLRMNRVMPENGTSRYEGLVLQLVHRAHEAYLAYPEESLEPRLDHVARTMARWIVWRAERPRT